MFKMRPLLAGFAAGLLLIGAALNATAADLQRGPYLQTPTSTSMVLKWRTDVITESVVRYGDAPGNLISTASSVVMVTEHAVTVSGLDPDTRYYYSVGSSTETLSGGGYRAKSCAKGF